MKLYFDVIVIFINLQEDKSQFVFLLLCHKKTTVQITKGVQKRNNYFSKRT